MSFPRYPKYKASGIEWLGDVPEHWGVHAFRRAILFLTDFEANCSFSEMRNHTTLDAGKPYAWYVRATDLENQSHGFNDENRFCDQTTYDFLKKTRLTGGEFLVTKRGEIGKVYVMPKTNERATLGPNLYLVRLNDRLLPEFCNYWFKGDYGKPELELRNQSTTIGALYKDDLKDCLCVYPTRDEQTLIASFLDSETAKIDELVAEKRQLIELLKEKRQAVISHAVTKGLNPHAPLKPSSIEWLGDVPEHWEVLSLRRVASSIQTGGTPSSVLPADEVQDGQVWYTPGDFGDSLRLTTSARMLAREVIASGDAKIFPPRSVLVVSIGATLGKVGFAEGASAANQQINAVVPNDKIDGYFCAYSLSAKAEVMRFLSNASTIGIMNQEKTKDIWLAVPPMKEQQTVTAHLDTETGELDTLIAEANRGIELLQERRTALISAAVTGKIDVRGLAETEAA